MRAKRWVMMVLLLGLAASCDEEGASSPAAELDAGVDAASLEDVGGEDVTADAPPVGGGLCEGEAAARGERLLGIDLLNVDASGAFEGNLSAARELGVDFIALHVAWTQLEEAPGVYTDPGGALAALAGVARAEGWRFSVTLRPVDLTGKTVPADLAGLRFNDPALIARFNAVVDFVLSIVEPELLVSLQIGNEIDAFDASGEAATFWSDYGVFLDAVVQHVHAAAPEARVGFTGTLEGLTRGTLHDLGVFTAYAGVVDVVGVTWYPQEGNFQVREPEEAALDLDRLVEAFPGTPLVLQEVGYQTSATCGSSPEAQARFFCAAFAAWDRHREQIVSFNLLRLNDLSAEQAALDAGPYGLESPEFLEYLQTLGIRTFEGEEKPAFGVVEGEAARRGW